MQLVMVRHGETVENVNRIVQGHNPGKLSELGRQQAKQLAEELKNQHFDAIYCSDLKLCKDTAAAVIKHHPKTPIHYTGALREFGFGSLQGMPVNKFTNFGARIVFGLRLKPPGGESRRNVRDRLTIFINTLLHHYPDGRLLLVTHGGPIRILRAITEGVPVGKMMRRGIVPNCSIWVFDITKPLPGRTSILTKKLQ